MIIFFTNIIIQRMHILILLCLIIHNTYYRITNLNYELFKKYKQNTNIYTIVQTNLITAFTLHLVIHIITVHANIKFSGNILNIFNTVYTVMKVPAPHKYNNIIFIYPLPTVQFFANMKDSAHKIFHNTTHQKVVTFVWRFLQMFDN